MRTINHITSSKGSPRSNGPVRRFQTGPQRGFSREDRIFHCVLPLLASPDDFAPGGSRDWGNVVLLEADFQSSLHEDRS